MNNEYVVIASDEEIISTSFDNFNTEYMNPLIRCGCCGELVQDMRGNGLCYLLHPDGVFVEQRDFCSRGWVPKMSLQES